MPAIQFVTLSAAESTTSAETTSGKLQKLQGMQGAFSNYMQQNSSNTARAAKQQTVIPQEKAKAADSGNYVQKQYEQYQSKSAAQAEKVSSNAESDSTDPNIPSDVLEEAVEEIKEIIKETLGVEEEQLDAAMELLGLTQADLLNPQQLIALTVELTGSENVEMMLFSEDFQTIMQEMTAVTEDLLQDLGMTKEQLMEQLQTMSKTEEQPMEHVPMEEVSVDKTQQITQTETQQMQEMPKEKAEETAPRAATVVEVPHKEVQEKEVQQTTATQQEQQEETKPLQGVQQKQEQSQMGEETATQGENTQTFQKEESVQENTTFDFHANVHQQEPTVHVQAPQDVTTQAPLPQVNIQDVIEQIVEYTRVNLSEDVKSIEMQLNPENLGKVYLHVSEKQGTVTAQLTAQNENLKEALIQQAVILKDSLNQQGIKVDAVEVSVGAHEFENNLERDAHSQEEQARQQEEQTDRRSRRSINLNDLNGLDGLSGLMSEEEALAAQIMRDNGNNVDYKA